MNQCQSSFRYFAEWVWNWHHGRFVKCEFYWKTCSRAVMGLLLFHLVFPLEDGRNGCVLLLSPPDVDDGVSESMHNLSSLLRHRGFNVVEDCCCRTQQSKLGPIPWFHSQMMELNNGRVVVVLTHLALERARQWAQRDRTKEEEGDHPHSAVFTACLFHIDSDAQLQKTRERFVLVTFDSDSCRKSQLPKPLLGLRLFRLPLQIKALLKELTVGGRARGTHRGVEVPTPSKSERKPLTHL